MSRGQAGKKGFLRKNIVLSLRQPIMVNPGQVPVASDYVSTRALLFARLAYRKIEQLDHRRVHTLIFCGIAHTVSGDVHEISPIAGGKAGMLPREKRWL